MNNPKAVFVVLFAIAISAFGQRAAANDDVRLFQSKCGHCHSWSRPVREFSGRDAAYIEKTIRRMAEKKPGFITEADAEAISRLFNESGALEVKGAEAAKKAAEKDEEENESLERLEETIKYVHAAWLGAVFVFFGIYMTLGGVKRLFNRLKLTVGFPGAFEWRKHIARGKLFVIFVIVGFLGGAAIFAIDGFEIGVARFHLFSGAAIAALYACGGAVGLRLARGKASAGLKTLHSAFNLTATALFLFNIASGVYLLFD